MKKRKTEAPSATTLRELPEVDFARYRVRRNPFAARIRREGIEVVHEGPSQGSLAEMPEADFSVSRVRRNPYASRAAESVPSSAWRALEAEARDKRTTVHALLRELVITHLERDAARRQR